MTEPADSPKQDYRDSVFLPKTDFPMKAGLPQKEPGILARWQAADFYAELRNRRRGREKFILHDGPPYANGDMHIGHALNHILKDMVVRTQTLLGKDAPYVPGWDCHGLPIEWKVEEQYRKKKLNKDEVPAVEFRAECRAYAQNWVDTQREQLKRLGINADWDNPYLTMDFQAEATIVAELLKFAESGQLYRGAKPVMWSPVEKTALAEAEVEYEDIVSTQIDVAFEIVEAPNEPSLVGAFAVIWTTTPWTIPVNQALAYGPEVDYVVSEVAGRRYIYALDLEAAFLSRLGVESVDRGYGPLKTGGLVDAFVRHPMHHLGGFFAKPRPMLAGDFVTTDSGTGLVHMRRTMVKMISICARRMASIPFSRSKAMANIAPTGSGWAVKAASSIPNSTRLTAPSALRCTRLAACSQHRPIISTAIRTAGVQRRRSSIGAPRNGSCRWIRRQLAPHCAKRRWPRFRTPASSPKRAATACRRWSKAALTGCCPVNAHGACRSLCL